jgi:hypothetical protein
LLAPWPATKDNTGVQGDPHHLPRNAIAPPDDEAHA